MQAGAFGDKLADKGAEFRISDMTYPDVDLGTNLPGGVLSGCAISVTWNPRGRQYGTRAIRRISRDS
jgi:hypothetical protein